MCGDGHDVVDIDEFLCCESDPCSEQNESLTGLGVATYDGAGAHEVSLTERLNANFGARRPLVIGLEEAIPREFPENPDAHGRDGPLHEKTGLLDVACRPLKIERLLAYTVDALVLILETDQPGKAPVGCERVS